MMELTKIKGATVKLDSIPFKDMIQSKSGIFIIVQSVL